MINFEVPNRWTGDVQFVAEIDCADDTPRSIKLGLAVKWAIENGANLEGADLWDADLEGANLRNANLWNANLRNVDLRNANLEDADLWKANLWNANLEGADLEGANLDGATGLNAYVKCIQVDKYSICYTSEIIQIGCQNHTIDEWRSFDDKAITEMDDGALEWWKEWKDWLFDLIEKAPAKPTKQEQSS